VLLLWRNHSEHEFLQSTFYPQYIDKKKTVAKSSLINILMVFFSGGFFKNKDGKIFFKIGNTDWQGVKAVKVTTFLIGLQHPSQSGPRIHVLPSQISNFLTSPLHIAQSL